MDCAGIRFPADDNGQKIPYTFYMKILITGASGLLGRAVFRRMKEIKGMEVTGLGFSRARHPLVKLNLLDENELSVFVNRENPDCIIHCAAERRPDVSEADPETSEKLNVRVTEHLAELAEKSGSFMVYISTDYVFDGKRPPYFPESKPNPLNFYGRTKLAGEKAVQSHLKNFAVLRIPVLYGGELYPKESSVCSIADALVKDAGGTFDDVAVRYPTYTDDVARVIAGILKYRESHTDFTGIYHWSGKEALTKYQMAERMASYLGIDKEKLTPSRSEAGNTKRPVNSHLDCTLLEEYLYVVRTGFENQIENELGRLYKIK